MTQNKKKKTEKYNEEEYISRFKQRKLTSRRELRGTTP